MSKQASTKVIGGFVVGAVVLVIAGLMIFGSGKLLREREKFVLFFDGSVNGLNAGAPVDFKGVKVGSVTDVKVILDRKDLSLRIAVFIEIVTNKLSEIHSEISLDKVLEGKGTQSLVTFLVNEGLRAKLEMQSLVTGQLGVNFDFYPDKPVRLVGIDLECPELPTIPSGLEELTKTFQKIPLDDIANKLLLAIEGIEKFVNAPDLKETMASLNETIKDAGALLRHIDDHVTPIASGIVGTTQDARAVLANINKQVPRLTSGLDETLTATRLALEQASKALRAVEDVAGDNSQVRYELANALKEMTGMARSIRVMADYLDRHPEALIRGKSGHEGR
jgi:paraquat-inducible protein B